MTDLKTIYQIKATLVGSKPPIWRRILVADTTTLSQLHTILQIAMGWTDSHLHLFRIGEQIYSDQEYDEEIEFETKSEKNYRLKQIASEGGFKFRYEYDFGDSWEHALLVEKILPVEKGRRYPVCIAGKRACPPEDVGGIWGYEELLSAMADPDNKENSELLEWAGSEFDPEEFHVEMVNDRLSHLIRPKKEKFVEPAEYIPAKSESTYLARALSWVQNITSEQLAVFESLAVLIDMQSFLNYLLENRTMGTPSTGNLPLKAVRAICSQFVEPTVLDETIGDHTYKLRSEYDVWPLLYIHILAEVAGLAVGGKSLVWRVTPNGKEFYQLPLSLQTLILLERWWRFGDWEAAVPFGSFDKGLPAGFNSKTLSCLLKLPINELSLYEVFADNLIEQSGLVWSIGDPVFARDILHTAIERMVINPLVGFGVLKSTHGIKIIGGHDYQELTAIQLTQIGKEMLELIDQLGS